MIGTISVPSIVFLITILYTPFFLSSHYNVQLFENERYSPLSGFSPQGLLMTDRKAVSVRDGSCGWNTLQEASLQLTSLGK